MMDLLTLRDLCPNQPENYNGFQDTDGCPDSFGSGTATSDGVLDYADECPLSPETYNRFQDTDGCPDSISSGALDSDMMELRMWMIIAL